MKQLALCAGILFAVAANAALTSRAPLVGQRVMAAAGGSPALICEYSGSRAKFEILAQRPTCAPYLDVR